MAASSEFKETIERTAERVLKALAENPQSPAPSAGAPEGRTAWDLKLELKVPNALIFLALGALVRDGRIELEPEGLTYRIHHHAKATIPSGQ